MKRKSIARKQFTCYLAFAGEPGKWVGNMMVYRALISNKMPVRPATKRKTKGRKGA